MINLIDYFFYKLEKFGRSLKLKDSPFSALAIFTLVEFLVVCINLNIFDFRPKVSKYMVWGCVGLLLGCNYFVFLYKSRYMRIREKYEIENGTRKTIGTIGVILFIIITFFLAFYTVRFINRG
jgi:hypothetical protein